MSDANVPAQPPTDNIEKFAVQCDVRATLWAAGCYGIDAGALPRCVDYLEDLRRRYGIDPDTAQAIIGKYFNAVRVP